MGNYASVFSPNGASLSSRYPQARGIRDEGCAQEQTQTCPHNATSNSDLTTLSWCAVQASVEMLTVLLALSSGVSALVPLFEARRPRHALMEKPWRVAVSGAGGQTGQSVFRKMLARPAEFAPLGLVRSEASREALIASGVPAEAVAVTDVTDPAAVKAAVTSCDAMVICTSAKPAPTGETDETLTQTLILALEPEPEPDPEAEAEPEPEP